MISPLFLCHGGPTLALEKNEYTDFLKQLGKNTNPKAIVVFTAHWDNEITTISASDKSYEMIYDFYGFPKELYSLKYPAKGSSEIATKLHNLLKASHIESQLDTERGLDHGAWDILYLMYPEANIPVVQVSVNPRLPMQQQLKLGEALRSLSEQDILVIGSGSTVHNLASVDWSATEPVQWAMEFDDWLIEKVEAGDQDALKAYRSLAPHARQAVPTEEHLVPMFIAMGSGNGNGSTSDASKKRLLHRSYAYGTLSYISFQF